VSCSSKAIENGYVKLQKYALVDLALGLEKDDGHSLCYYKALRPSMQTQIANYLMRGGRILVNGAYFATDMKSNVEQEWLAKFFKVSAAGSNQDNYNSIINGLGSQFDIYRAINEEHYGAYSPDILQPLDTAFSVMKYADNTSAAVAYKGSDFRTFVMAFPFECIKNKEIRNRIMRGIVAYLLN